MGKKRGLAFSSFEGTKAVRVYKALQITPQYKLYNFKHLIGFCKEHEPSCMNELICMILYPYQEVPECLL